MTASHVSKTVHGDFILENLEIERLQRLEDTVLSASESGCSSVPDMRYSAAAAAAAAICS